jgi:hypothetical protein
LHTPRSIGVSVIDRREAGAAGGRWFAAVRRNFGEFRAFAEKVLSDA